MESPREPQGQTAPAEARGGGGFHGRELMEALAAQQELKARIQEMKRSVSWRITAPIREVGRVSRRVGKWLGKRVLKVDAKAGRERVPGLKGGEGTVFDVVFLIGCWDGESKRYRVYNVADALRRAGHRVDVLPLSDVARLSEENLRPKLVVIFRATEGSWTEPYFAYARKAGIRTVFDVDDLIFEPGLVERVHGYHMLKPEDQAQYRKDVGLYERLMLMCDAVTVTTEALAEHVRRRGRPVHVIPNSWNTLQADIAEHVLAAPRPSSGSVVIGYFSGSRTHDRDFREAAPALVRLMREREDIVLHLVGELDPGEEFLPFGRRVERQPFMPYDRMLKALAACDINIAPLEPGNPFNEAKSELKWFEAALVGVPSVVTPTAPFRSAVRHGETGFLAAGEAEWYDSLSTLVSDAERRAAMGRAARAAALADFGPDKVREAARAAYALPAPSHAPAQAGAVGKRIDWIIPGLILGGGGHRNILRAAYFLEKFGHDVELIFTDTTYTPDQIRYILHQHFYPFSGIVRRYDNTFRYSDVIFATSWRTVDAALRARGMTRELMYFVQDFEPLFSPMGTDYVLAETTYRQGLYCITSGPWCEHVLRRDYGAQADHFEFPVDRDVYFPRPRAKKNLNVLYFAKPEMPRRCYELGVMMLQVLHRLMPDLEIRLYGSPHIRTETLGFPATLLGVMPTISDLAEAYSNADLGIVFSTTNPSLVPYEMMACGTPVVDLGRPGNEINYGGSFDIALLADPDPARMARQVRDLLLDRKALAERAQAGIELVSRMPSEEHMARRVEELILNRLAVWPASLQSKWP